MTPHEVERLAVLETKYVHLDGWLTDVNKRLSKMEAKMNMMFGGLMMSQVLIGAALAIYLKGH